MKRNGNAEGARIEAPRGMESPTGGGVWEGGRAPPPLHINFFDFLSGNGAFWCILGACFNVSIRRVKQSRKAVLCANCQLVSYLAWRTYHRWYHNYTHKHIYQSQQSTSQTHMQLILWTDIHVHATIYLYLYILLSCILFQEMQFLFTKVTFC